MGVRRYRQAFLETHLRHCPASLEIGHSATIPISRMAAFWVVLERVQLRKAELGCSHLRHLVQDYSLSHLASHHQPGNINMESSELDRFLTRRFRRGLVIFSILWLISVGWAGQTLVASGNRAWAVAAFFAAMLSGLGFQHVRKGFIVAKRVSANPKIVYWAHSSGLRLPLSTKSQNFFILHLRDGSQLEVLLPEAEMTKFIDWLKEQNPSVRMGPYDDFTAW